MGFSRFHKKNQERRDPEQGPEGPWGVGAGYFRPVPPGDEASWCVTAPLRVDYRGPRKYLRCPKCNRRLLPSEQHCVGGELLGWQLPPHKLPPAKKKKPKRKERNCPRGRR